MNFRSYSHNFSRNDMLWTRVTLEKFDTWLKICMHQNAQSLVTLSNRLHPAFHWTWKSSEQPSIMKYFNLFKKSISNSKSCNFHGMSSKYFHLIMSEIHLIVMISYRSKNWIFKIPKMQFTKFMENYNLQRLQDLCQNTFLKTCLQC